MKRRGFILPWLLPVTLFAAETDFPQDAYRNEAVETESALAAETDAARRLDLLLRLSEIHQDAGNQDKAGQLADQALALASASTALSTSALTAPATGTDDARLRALVRRIDVSLAQQRGMEAGDLLSRLLPLAERTAAPLLRAMALNSEGNVLRFGEEYAGALLAYREAAALAEARGATLLQVQALSNAADTAFSAEQPQAGLEYLRQAWARLQQLAPGNERLQEGLALARMALQHEVILAGEILALARQDMTLSVNERLHSYFHAYSGQLHEQAGDHEKALQLTDQALFFAQTDDGLGYLWQWQRGRILHTQGRTQAAAGAYRKALALLQPIRSGLLNGRRSTRRVFREDIQPVYYALADVLLRQAVETAGEDKQNLLRQARDTLEQIKAAELQNYFQDECVTALRRKQARLDELDPHTAVLYPVLLQDRTELLVSLGGEIFQYTVALGKPALSQAVGEWQQHLQNRMHWRFIEQARHLYDTLVRPLESLLSARQVDTLVVVPDGALRMVPFAALHDGQHYLIENYAVVTTPGLDLTDPRPLPRQDVSVLLIGLSKSVQGFRPLPNVPVEIENLEKLYARRNTLIDETFLTRRVQLSLEQTPYRIVHMASHGQFERDPNNSFVLTYDDKLTLNRLEKMLTASGYRDKAVELLTLSACQTATGDEMAALGLAGVAIKAGARSALASLWLVDDAATAELMGEFYRQMQNPQVSKAQALRAAQRKLLQQRQFRHPRYWSPFLLIGNWL
jgi:CHAT domain-containing protein